MSGIESDSGLMTSGRRGRRTVIAHPRADLSLRGGFRAIRASHTGNVLRLPKTKRDPRPLKTWLNFFAPESCREAE